MHPVSRPYVPWVGNSYNSLIYNSLQKTRLPAAPTGYEPVGASETTQIGPVGFPPTLKNPSLGPSGAPD